MSECSAAILFQGLLISMLCHHLLPRNAQGTGLEHWPILRYIQDEHKHIKGI